ncbi:MAG TPA: hypothetical protein VEY70_07715 [Metabacillus sp.]|nr:hypothetical protein [Metabacillus sp.]
MQPAKVGSDATCQIQQLYKQLFLRTEFILNNYMDEYCEFLYEIEIEDDYLNAYSEIEAELNNFSITNEEIKNFINGMVPTF